MKLFDIYLHGTCDLFINGDKRCDVPCFLNLIENSFDCQVPLAGVGISLSLDKKYCVQNVKLIGPAGSLTCANLPLGFARRVGGGSFSVDQTQTTHTLGMKPQTSVLSFVLNKPVVFETQSDIEEILFFPGLDIYGSVNVDENWCITGAKGFISVSGDFNIDLKFIETALAIAIGAPVRRFSHLKGNQIELILNHYGSEIRCKPLFHSGYPIRDIHKAKENLGNVFSTTLNYIKKLNSIEKVKMRNAVYSYLEGRVINGSFELKLLAVFHFLEWFDGSRTISPNQLVRRLNIDRCEADGIYDIRNDVTHNRKDIEVAVNEGCKKIMQSKRPFVTEFPTSEPGQWFINYIYTLLGDALLCEIGYEGETQAYYPFK